jgi:hypothetical protein
MINVTVHVPSREFASVLNEYASKSKKTFVGSVNSRLRDVVIRAYRYTKIADRAKIEHRLGVVGFRTSISRKTGKFVRRKSMVSVAEESLAERIVQKKYRDKHGFGRWMPRDEAREAARKYIASIVRTIGFIRSGWIPAIKRLDALSKKQSGIDRKEMRGRPKGGARPALRNDAERFFAEAWNSTKVASEVTHEAVARAMSEVQANMERILAGELGKVIEETSRKKIK